MPDADILAVKWRSDGEALPKNTSSKNEFSLSIWHPLNLIPERFLEEREEKSVKSKVNDKERLDGGSEP